MDIHKIALKFIYKVTGSIIANAVLKRKNKDEEISLPNFKDDYIARLISTMEMVGVEFLGQ